MAAAIEAETGVKAELVKGDAGAFVVIADGKTLFSKHETGRFPDEEEILVQLRA